MTAAERDGTGPRNSSLKRFESSPPLAGKYLVNTSNLDEAATILGSAYGPIRIGHGGPDTEARLRIWRTRVGPVTLDDADVTSDIRFEMDEPDGVLLCRVRAGDVEFRIGGQSHTFARGDMLVLRADGATLTGVLREARCDLVSIDPKVLNGHTSDCRRGKSFKRLALPVSAPAAQQLADVIDHIRRFVANNPLVAQEQQVLSSAARYLAATMKFAFPCSVFAV